MADKPDDTSASKPPFWSSLPGILTAFGGVIVAVTGLVTALYSTGVIGTKANANTSPPANMSVAVASAPSPSPSKDADNPRYRSLAGTWEVLEERPKQLGGAKVVWSFEAAVSGDVLRLNGKMKSVNGKDLSPREKDIRAIFETKMVDSMGVGFFETTDKGVSTRYPATIRLENDSPTFHGTIDIKGQLACSLMGSKL